MATIARRARGNLRGAPLSNATPYVESADVHESRVDHALLARWNSAAPYLLGPLLKWRLRRFVRRVESLEKETAALSEGGLREAAETLRGRLSLGNSDEIATAFALTREAARRHTGMQHFPVQLLGGAAMMRACVAEMQTGEGKTLTALLPAVASALAGRPVQIITVNDYLARRDAETLRPVFAALGLTVGLIQHGQQAGERQHAYACDVTYCNNKELVFDYLRDRLALGPRRARTHLLLDSVNATSQRTSRPLLRGLHVAIVDEADSVLIDEARTPLILSGQGEGETDAETYGTALDLARRLSPGEAFQIVSGDKTVSLTEAGKLRVAELTRSMRGLWAIRRAREELVRQAIAALHLFRRDSQYIVAEGKVQIVDEYTGRVMPDRSWEHGMHQLIECKEGCTVTGRNQTLARITYQRFFRRYVHLCGMTGTAVETSGELGAVYGLGIACIPTNRPLRRLDCGTRLYQNADQKWRAVLESAQIQMSKHRAVLIGTRSVAASERIGRLLLEAGIRPALLNARQDRQEAEIVAAAGLPGRVTVATNMAGRGTDIKLHPTVRDAGGLHVILTEFHESRRIDRQLFGRAGRQGDPGSHESIVALDDELFTRFAGRSLLPAVRMISRRDQVCSAAAELLRKRSQAAAERRHARVRRATLEEDYRLDSSLGFAGAE